MPNPEIEPSGAPLEEGSLDLPFYLCDYNYTATLKVPQHPKNKGENWRFPEKEKTGYDRDVDDVLRYGASSSA